VIGLAINKEMSIKIFTFCIFYFRKRGKGKEKKDGRRFDKTKDLEKGVTKGCMQIAAA
jgi:hypothetical protein